MVLAEFERENFIFDESFSRAIVGVKDEGKFADLAIQFGLKVEKIGITGGDKFELNGIKRDLKVMQNIYFNEFAKIIRRED